MRAALSESVGAAPVVREVPEPEPGEGEALVEVTAAPLNPIDLSIASGRFYAGPPQTPYVPGVEGVGQVVRGERLAAGTRIWFNTGAGYGRDGSLAERVAVHEAGAIEITEPVDDALAACFGVAGLAAWLALDWRGELKEGETVLVLGASGAVGAIAVQAAKLLGAARVVAAARDAAALERARERGADATVDLSAHEGAAALASAIQEAAGGLVNLTVDPLWGEPAVAAAMATAPGGRLVQLGQSASPEATLPSALVRGRLLSILGLTNALAPQEAKAEAYRRMLEHASAGRLTIDYDTFPLDSIAEAWERQTSSPHRKLVVLP